MKLIMNLKQKIEEWDQKSAADIQSIYDEYQPDKTFIAELNSLIPQPDTETGATWLLKAYLEDHGQISNKASRELFISLAKLSHWEAKLHCLQCLPYLQIDEADKTKVELFIRESLQSKNKFVRAWAYSGFFELSNQHSEFQDAFERRFKKAIKHESPSVKARLRNIQKKRQ